MTFAITMTDPASGRSFSTEVDGHAGLQAAHEFAAGVHATVVLRTPLAVTPGLIDYLAKIEGNGAAPTATANEQTNVIAGG